MHSAQRSKMHCQGLIKGANRRCRRLCTCPDVTLLHLLARLSNFCPVLGTSVHNLLHAKPHEPCEPRMPSIVYSGPVKYAHSSLFCDTVHTLAWSHAERESVCKAPLPSVHSANISIVVTMQIHPQYSASLSSKACIHPQPFTSKQPRHAVHRARQLPAVATGHSLPIHGVRR